MTDPYQTLGVSRTATDDEIKSAYRDLARKYHPDNYGDDNPLKHLAEEKMQEINAAYDAIQKERAGRGTSYSDSSSYESNTSSNSRFGEIRRALNARRFGEAERLLAQVSDFDRDAEWHYLNSVVLMKRGRVNDAMRELEMACSMDPSNIEYQKAKQMFNQRASGYGSTYYGDSVHSMNGNTDDCCTACLHLLWLDCLCECLGGDLIPCC